MEKEKMIEKIRMRFAVSKEEAISDVEYFTKELEKKKIISAC